MNSFVFYLLIVLVVLLVVYMVLKKRKVVELNKAIEAKDWKSVISITHTKSASYLLSAYVRDFYCAKAYQMNGDEELLKTHLRKMFKTSYSTEDTGQYLILYYHLYMIQKDVAFAEEILDLIKKSCNKKVVVYCEWTWQVLVEQKTDLIETMEEAIDKKQYYAFPLGVICYLVGVQKMILNETKDAITWLATALSVFQKKDLYVDTINKEMKMLKEMDIEQE